MGYCQSFMKEMLYTSNLIFVFMGLILQGVGITVHINIVAEMCDFNVLMILKLTICVGIFLFLVAFFGCYGLIRESSSMLNSYAALMTVLMVLKIALAALIFFNVSRYLDEIPQNLERFFSEDISEFRITVETKFKCSGTNENWPELETPTCNEAVTAFATTFAVIIAFFATVAAALELGTVVYALCLAYSIRIKKGQADAVSIVNVGKNTDD